MSCFSLQIIVVAGEIPRRKDSKFHILRQACEQESSFQDCETAKKGAFKRPLHTQHGPVNVVICQLKSESLMITVNDSALSEVPDQDKECLEHQVHILYSKLVGNYCRAHRDCKLIVLSTLTHVRPLRESQD